MSAEEEVKKWIKDNPFECPVEGCKEGKGGRPFRCKKMGAMNFHKYKSHNVTSRDGFDAKTNILTFTIPVKYKFLQDVLNNMEDEEASDFIAGSLIRYGGEVAKRRFEEAQREADQWKRLFESHKKIIEAEEKKEKD